MDRSKLVEERGDRQIVQHRPVRHVRTGTSRLATHLLRDGNVLCQLLSHLLGGDARAVLCLSGTVAIPGSCQVPLLQVEKGIVSSQITQMVAVEEEDEEKKKEE